LDQIYGHRGYRPNYDTGRPDTMGFDHRAGGTTYEGRYRHYVCSPMRLHACDSYPVVGRSGGNYALTAKNLETVPDGAFRLRSQRWGSTREERQDRREPHEQQGRRHTVHHASEYREPRNGGRSRSGCGGFWDIFRK
jgi:hypothetical protein